MSHDCLFLSVVVCWFCPKRAFLEHQNLVMGEARKTAAKQGEYLPLDLLKEEKAWQDLKYQYPYRH